MMIYSFIHPLTCKKHEKKHKNRILRRFNAKYSLNSVAGWTVGGHRRLSHPKISVSSIPGDGKTETICLDVFQIISKSMSGSMFSVFCECLELPRTVSMNSSEESYPLIHDHSELSSRFRLKNQHS